MKIARLNEICTELFERYQADPTDLYLRPESRMELATEALESAEWDTLHVGDGHSTVGVLVTEVANPVTRSVMGVHSLSPDSSDGDYLLTRVYV